MPFDAELIANANNSAIEEYISKGKVFVQNVANKPMLKAFDEARGSFSGGNMYVSLGVKSGQGGGSLVGYTGDDQLGFYNPLTNKRVKYPWKEHWIGLTWSHTEAKLDGLSVEDDGGAGGTSAMSGREVHVLAEIIDSKNDDMGEDYAKSLDLLLHGDGTSDTKAIAGIQAFILDNPDVGVTGGLNRATNAWWRNRCLTTTGGGVVTSSTAGGGALLQALQKEFRLLGKFAQGGTRMRYFAGGDFYEALEKELRGNGSYTNEGFMGEKAVDGGMAAIKFKGKEIVHDYTLDDIGRAKFMYAIDMRRIQLKYMDGQRMKRHTPARPYDRLVHYNGISTTAVMVAQQLNTSGVYEIG